MGPPQDASQEPPEGTVEVPFRRLSPLTPIARSGIFLAAVAFYFGRDMLEGRGTGEIGIAGLALAAALVGGLTLGFVSWWRTQFRITATELRLDTGLLSRQSRRVRLDRVVAIDINQPFVARLLGLAELRVETATTESEVSLAFLPHADARRLRELLLAERAALAARGDGAPTGEPGATAGGQDGVRLAADPVPLVDVRTSWQLVSLLVSVETVVVLLLLATVVVLISFGADLSGLGAGLAAVVGGLITFLRKLVGQWNWRVGALPTGLHVKRGLFNVSSQTFHVARLQGVRVLEPRPWRPWGLARLEISIAGGTGQSGEEAQTGGLVLPAAPRELVWRLARDLVGTDARAVATARPPRRASWLAPIGRPFLSSGYDDRLLVVRRSWLVPSTSVVPLARAQSLRVASGPLQRLLSLASVRLDSPDGASSLTAPHLARGEARDFFDGLVERARSARMPTPAVLVPDPAPEPAPDPGP